MKLESKVLYNLELGQMLMPDNNSIIVRVPGGWIWGFGNDWRSAVFVPFHNEFMKKSQNIEGFSSESQTTIGI